MKIKLSILLIILIVIPQHSIWADDNIYLPPSPDAASIGKYGQYPVTLYNGLVGINVPIYTIKLRQFELPISLSYHASGIKIDEISSCVGLGWSLQAGGVITRSVNGLPDVGFENNHLGFSLTQDQVRNLSDESFISYLSERYRCEVNNSDDSESDVYYYNVGGLSGSFRFDYKGNLVQVPMTNNKIEYNNSSFTITGTDGTVYGFQSKEISKSRINGSDIPYVSSWYLSFIQTHDQQEIIFEYYSDDTVYIDLHETSSMAISHQNVHAQSVSVRQFYSTTSHTLLLKKIRYPGGEINFVYADRLDCRNNRLSKVIVSNNISYYLEHSYFVNHNCKRLKLEGVNLISTDNKSLGRYSFDYITSVNLPPYLSSNTALNYLYRGQDLWGYYNGVTTNKHLLMCKKLQTYNYHFEQADRSVNPIYAKANSLRSVTYPTGGRTIFEYEGNRDEHGTYVGGLRIKNIISYDGGDTPSTIRSYEYGASGNNRYGNDFLAGCGYTQMAYYGVNTYTYFYDLVDIVDHYMANSSIPLSYSGGSPIYYKKVTENDGYPNACNGKIEYAYSYSEHDIDYTYNPDYYIIPSLSTSEKITPLIFLPKFIYQFVDRSWTRGFPKNISVYSMENGRFILKKKTDYHYRIFNKQNSIVGFHSFANIWPNVEYVKSTNTTFPYSRSLFQYRDVIAETGLIKLTEVMDTIYEDARTLATTTYHYYDRLNNQYEVTRTYTTNSDGSISKKSYKYPKDYNIGVYSKMVERNMLTPVIETRDSIDNKFLKTTRTYYNYWQNAFFAPSHCIEMLFSGVSKVLYKYQKYGEKGNPIFITRSDGENVVYLWGYEYQYPIAEIRNATYTDVVNAISGGESTIRALSLSKNPDISIVNALRQALPNSLITTCKYKPTVGMLERTEPNGITTYYIYDSAGRLSRIWNNKREAVKSFEYNYVNK